MKLQQMRWTPADGWEGGAPKSELNAQVVMLFGGREAIGDTAWLGDLKKAFPKATLFGCSTSGEIADVEVTDDNLVCTAIEFEHTGVQMHQVSMDDMGDSTAAGRALAAKMEKDGLNHVFVLSDGLQVNGSDLVSGMMEELPAGVQVTGGLAGDGANFEHTTVLAGDVAKEGVVAALGFSGDKLDIGFGSLGGWDAFGPERRITRSEGNVLFELDGKPALELYKTYLADQAEGLPATGLLFPLSVKPEGRQSVVRTILAVSEEDQSLTFAGDVPQGAVAQLMKANFDRLVEGAAGAAKNTLEQAGGGQPDLALLISCVGRKLVLKQRTEDEVEGVQGVLGDDTVMTGFYSYGEICPSSPDAACDLHNQTMTITTFSESS